MLKAHVARVAALLCVGVAVYASNGAGPTSEPASQPASYPALQKKLADLSASVDRLQSENAMLRKENADLKTKMADLATVNHPAKAMDDPKVVQAKWHDAVIKNLVAGMNRDDALRFLGKPTEELREGQGFAWYYRTDGYELKCRFDDSYIIIRMDERTVP